MSLGVSKNIQDYLEEAIKILFQLFICIKLDFLSALQPNNRVNAEADMRIYFSIIQISQFFILKNIFSSKMSVILYITGLLFLFYN